MRINRQDNVQDSSYKAYYADRVTKKLLRFEYDLDKGELGESTMVADFSDFAGNMTQCSYLTTFICISFMMAHTDEIKPQNGTVSLTPGLMTGLVADNKGRLWSGFRGSREVKISVQR